MEIKYIGQKQIEIKGKKETVMFNPVGEIEKLDSRIIIYSNKENGGFKADTNKVLIYGPGEYEIGGVEIKGYSAAENEVIYLVEMEGIMVAVLADISEPLSDKRVERIEGVDVVVAAIDNMAKVSPKTLMDWSKKWGVNYLIPIAYDEEKLKKFLDVVDEEGLEPIDVLKVNRDELPDGLEVCVLNERSNKASA